MLAGRAWARQYGVALKLMRVIGRFRQGELSLGRIEALSDGVFAIVVTLLVLDLTVPKLGDPRSSRELARGLVVLLPKLLSWLISFVIVCKFWVNHHHIFNLASHADYSLVWLNAIFLMFQSFIPFPTALMGRYPTNSLAVSLFGLTMALNTLLFITLHAHIIRHLLKPELTERIDPHIIAKSFAGPLIYSMGAAAAWINVDLAFASYLLTPPVFIVPPQLGQAPRTATAARAAGAREP